MILLERPTIARLVGYEDRPDDLQKLQKALSYTDGRLDFELGQHRKRKRWFINKYGSAAWNSRHEALKRERQKCLLLKDKSGYYIPSGLAKPAAELTGDTIKLGFKVPEPDVLPWGRKPEHPMRPYQEAAKGCLIEARHAAIEHCTGAGKSRTLLELFKHYALQSVAMAPSKSIAGQLYADLVHHFGARYVGFYGDGKKQLGKLFTVAIGASLTRIEPGSKEWDFFSKTQVVIGDESHLLPASTLEKVMYGLLADAPIRHFLSATQMRNDGLDLVLEGITGPIVHRYTLAEGVRDGFLAQPRFTMLQVKSDVKFDSDDANDMTRRHLFYNPKVNQLAGYFASKFVTELKRPTVILVDEIEQFSHLLPHLKHEARFAYGSLTKENKHLVPEQYRDADNDKLVDEFNQGKFPILVGTSCISTGTDIRVAEAVIYLQGGKSEIQAKQGIGRGTRGGFNAHVFNPGTGEKKLDCYVVDFDVQVYPTDADEDADEGLSATHRHAMERRSIYEATFPPVAIKDYRHV